MADATTMPRPRLTRDQRLFEMDHLYRDLRGRSVRGAAATMLSQAGNFCIQFAGLAVLARMLSPSDFGVFGKAVALTGFINALRSGGLSLATVQRAQINHAQVSNLFWLNVGLGALAAALLAALSPLMAWFYHDPRVLWLGFAMAGAAFVDSLSIQHTALMQRQMRFSAMGGIVVAAKLAGFVAAAISAWRGAGFWALAVQQYATTVAWLVLVVVMCRWLPSWPRRGTGVMPMLKIGANQTGFSVLNFASRNVDNVLLGRFVTDAALGFYSQAYRLLLLPIQQINAPLSSVVMPTLSRLQHQPERYARFYYRALGTMVFFGMPVVCFLFVDAKPGIELVLGAKWLPSVEIFQALGIAAFIGTFNVAGGWVCTSLGWTDRQFKWQLLATPVTLGAFFLGLPWGALGVAASFSATRVLLIWPSLVYSFRGSPIRMTDTFFTLLRPAVAAITAGLVVWGIHLADPQWPITWIALDMLLYGAVYLGIWVILPGGVAHLRSLTTIVKDFKSSKPTV
jgi:O-antigen/teichoic acid export membrane protein